VCFGDGLFCERFFNRGKNKKKIKKKKKTIHPSIHQLVGDPSSRTGLVYDERMQWHVGPANFPERGDRIARVREQLGAEGLAARCRIVPIVRANRALLETCHAPRYLDSLEAGGGEFVQRDMYDSPHATLAAQLACGGAVAAALAVAPPGDEEVDDNGMEMLRDCVPLNQVWILSSL
jgi:hypothetical protein